MSDYREKASEIYSRASEKWFSESFPGLLEAGLMSCLAVIWLNVA